MKYIYKGWIEEMKHLEPVRKGVIKSRKENYMVMVVVTLLFGLFAAMYFMISGGMRYAGLAGIVFMGILLVMAIYKAFEINDHIKKLAASKSYLEEEDFDTKYDLYANKLNILKREMNLTEAKKVHADLEAYTEVLKERVKPLRQIDQKKVPGKLTYEQRIIYTVNQKTLSELLDVKRHLENLIEKAERPSEETEESVTFEVQDDPFAGLLAN